MTTTQQIITITAVVLGTMATRFLPFIIFSADSTPDFVRFLGRVLPNAVIGLLVIYSLKDSIGGINHCIPELIALVLFSSCINGRRIHCSALPEEQFCICS